MLGSIYKLYSCGVSYTFLDYNARRKGKPRGGVPYSLSLCGQVILSVGLMMTDKTYSRDQLSTTEMWRVFQGTIIHSTISSPMEILENKILGVKGSKIVFLKDASAREQVLQYYGISGSAVRQLKSGQFVIPGFIDTHTHAPQYAMLGTSLDKGLEEWLSSYTYPTEAKFADPEFAKHIYEKVVRRFLINGTTTVCYYGTIHLKACQVLCDIIESEGQRAFVGKVNMDRNSPHYYQERTENAIDDARRFVQSVLERKNKLLTPVVTPRFAASCSSKLLQQLADIADEQQVPIQTHISECGWDCVWTRELFPESIHYADVYDRHNLLTPKTILGHGVYLTDVELETIKNRKCGISHCANSNATLRSGILNVRKLLDMGIKVGLGTDVSAGHSPSILDAIRTSLLVSNILYATQDARSKWLTFKDAFKLATLGGAQVLGLDSAIGNFEVGKDFDAQIIDCGVANGPFDIFLSDSVEEEIQKFIYQGDDRNITEVFVSGKRVK